MRLRVGVVYGGRSSEHEVSLASAAEVIGNLDRHLYEPVPIYISREGRWSLPVQPPTTTSAAEVIKGEKSPRAEPTLTEVELHFVAHPAEAPAFTIQRTHDSNGVRTVIDQLRLDVVFPVVHGPYGEDGTLQGLLELGNVPYVGSGVLASSVAMDKAVTKTLLGASGLPIVEHAVVKASQWDANPVGTIDKIMHGFELPLFVKPANLGSSVGVSKAKNRAELEKGIDLARQFDNKILVEVAIPEARELECAVIGNDIPEASVVGEIVPAREFYDYDSKYLDVNSTTVIPASLEPGQADEIRTMAVKSFQAINGTGMARVDFLMPRHGKQIYVNELNTIPGFTTISMYANLWQASGLDYPRLVGRLIDLALERHKAKQQLRTRLTS